MPHINYNSCSHSDMSEITRLKEITFQYDQLISTK